MPSRLRVLLIPSWYPHPVAPIAGIFVQAQAQVLSKLYETAVLVPELIGWREWRGGRCELASSWQGIQNGVRVWRETIAYPPKLPIQIKALLAKQLTQSGLRKILTHWGRPDLIHAHVVFPAGYAALHLSKQLTIPVLLTEHTGPFSDHLKTPADRRLTAQVLTEMLAVIAVSPALAAQIHAFFPKVLIEVIGNVVQTDYFQIPPAPRPPLVDLFVVASLEPIKGLRYLLEALALLNQRGFKGITLAIGGAGKERTSLQKLAQQLGIAAQCEFLGMLLPHQVREYMQRCRLFVLPSLAETFGVVLIEAMACGTPVVATRSGGPEFIVTPETGVLVPPADPVALASGIATILSSPISYNPQHIRQSVETRFGAQAFLRPISAIYSRVLGTNALSHLAQ